MVRQSIVARVNSSLGAYCKDAVHKKGDIILTGIVRTKQMYQKSSSPFPKDPEQVVRSVQQSSELYSKGRHKDVFATVYAFFGDIFWERRSKNRFDIVNTGSGVV